jgi:hypothetical protein
LQADVRNIGTLDFGEYIRRSATLGINSTSDYEDFVQAKIMYSSAKYMRAKYLYAGGTPLYGDKYEECMRASAKLQNNGTSEYGDRMHTRETLDGTFDYEEYMRAKHMYVEYMHKYEECMRASAKLLNNGTSEYGECMPTRTFDYEEYIRATETLHLNKVGLYLKEKILGSNEDNYVSE